MKYDHAVAAAQKSTSGRTGPSTDDDKEEVEEEADSDGSDVAKKDSKQTDSISAAEEAQRAADLVEAVRQAHRKLQQLQASRCVIHALDECCRQAASAAQTFVLMHHTNRAFCHHLAKYTHNTACCVYRTTHTC